MKPFEFHPELFEFRNTVLEKLAEKGFVWLFDFSSVDLLHDVYGLEVCGIREEADARSIQRLLRNLFPNWHYTYCFYKDHTTRDLGWKVIIARDQEDFNDRWQRIG